MPGSAIQIIKTDKDDLFVLDKTELEKLLLQDHIKDRFVVIISVAGAFRKGKSFLLNFFLRYLYSTYVHCKSSNDWLGDESVPLSGFSWRGGCERDTTGILMWSDVFLHDFPNGEKVAIILLDTQGIFDSQTTHRKNVTIFALSTMLSSVQIFNMKENIQEDDLQHLQLFTEYGRLALEDTDEKPFQKLQFLIRDWSNPHDAEYGSVGGEKFLKMRLEGNKKHPELETLRHHIKSCFNDITCFLMPHPGLNVIDVKFNGQLADIAPNFKDNLQSLVPMLLAPENLILKQTNGQNVRAQDIIQYFQSYMAIFNSDKMPEPKSMFEATAEANILSAVNYAKELYLSEIKQISGETYINVNDFMTKHLLVKSKALTQFDDTRKMGGSNFFHKYRAGLEADLDAISVTITYKIVTSKALARTTCVTAAADSKELYYTKMASICGPDTPYLEPEQMRELDVLAKENAIRHFDSKMGGIPADFSNGYRTQLKDDLKYSYDVFARTNSEKHNPFATGVDFAFKIIENIVIPTFLPLRR